MNEIRVTEINPTSHDSSNFQLVPEKRKEGHNFRYSATLKREILKTNKYILYVNGEKPHVISNLITTAVPTFGMASENYECDFTEYTLDGVKVSSTAIVLRR